MSTAISMGETSVVERERRSPRAGDRERALEEMEQRGKSVEGKRLAEDRVEVKEEG